MDRWIRRHAMTKPTEMTRLGPSESRFSRPCGGPSNSSQSKRFLNCLAARCYAFPPTGAVLGGRDTCDGGSSSDVSALLALQSHRHCLVEAQARSLCQNVRSSHGQELPPPGVKTPQFILDLTFGNFVKGLLEFGYEQGRNIDIIRRTDIFTDRVPTIEEMVALVKPDIIVAPATLEAVAARKATSTIPIVCAALADAVHLGLIASEARPGGNVTGIEPYIAGLPTKQIELAREVVPTARRVGLLTNMNDPKGPPQVGDLKDSLPGFRPQRGRSRCQHVE